MPKQWLVLSSLLLGAVLEAQPAGKGMSRMMYDPNSEITIKGTVQDITQATRGMMGGTHLTIKTADATMEVMLGPSQFLEGKGFSFAKGDEVEVTGSKVTMGGTQSLIAREIVKGGRTLTLRDKAGMPEWRGMMHGGQRP